MENIENLDNSKITKKRGRPLGKKQQRNNYLLLWLNINTNEYEKIDEFKTIEDIKNYLNNKNINLTEQILKRIINNRNKKTIHTFLKIQKI